ncbi:MAG: phosphotransferase family protein [Bryobacteraceae bacterium]
MQWEADTAPLRPGEEINTAALSDYLRGRVEGADSGVSLEQFPGGHSNLTYLVRAGDREYVLRRAPLGPVPPKAHDMAREYRLLARVHPLFPAAPNVYLLCEDAAVIGSAFFLMERRRGLIFRDRMPAALEREADLGARVSRAFLDCLIDLHAIDIERHGLAALGKAQGFMERQVCGWSERWNRAKTEDLPEMDTVMRWLGEALPVSGPATLVHNDYKLDNVMLNASDPGRIEAVLDWEMATVGDPLADLGLTLCYWTLGSASAGERASVSTGPGWYTRDGIVASYGEKTGRDVSGIRYYEVLGVFKLAVILQQIYFRYARGQTRDQRFRGFDRRVRGLVDTAVGLARNATKNAG